MSIEQRIGPGSRALWVPETALGEDPATVTAVVLPLREQMGFGASDTLNDAPYFAGNRLPDDVTQGMITAEGSLPLGLEFLAIGHLLKAWVGADGYSKETIPDGYLHRFIVDPTSCAALGSGQIQSEFCGTAKEYLRDKGIRVNSFDFTFAADGTAGVDVALIGTGQQAQTDIDTVATVTIEDNGYTPTSYFNGFAKMDGVTLEGLTNFSLSMTNNISRQDAAFRDGYAAALNAGKLQISGTLELMFGDGGALPESDLTWYNKAVNQSLFAIDCAWSDLPPASATAWLRVQLPQNRAQRNAPRPGGEAGIVVSQEFRTVNRSATAPAEVYSTPSPTIGAGDLVVKVDGGGGQTFTMTGGETVAEAAAIVNATATGFTAVEMFGRLVLVHDTGGSTSTLQVDATSTVTGLNFDNTVHSGWDDCPMMVSLANSRSTDY